MLVGVALALVVAGARGQGVAAGGAGQGAGAGGRPNILLIVADDMRADALGVAGNKDIRTPNLDAFSARAAYFTKATCYVAQCCPWRAMMVTGLAPHQSGYTSMDIQQGKRGRPDGFDDLPTMPGLLRDAGYRTVLVGKWHIKPDPWQCGFTEVRRWFPGGMGPYSDPMLCCGDSREQQKVPGFVTEIFAEDAIGFLRGDEAKAGPWFMWLAMTAPHEPCEPTPERIGAMYDGKTSDDLVLPGIEKGASARWKDKWLPYYRAVTHLDEQVGRVLGVLNERGLAGDTVVIFVSDSGIMMGRRGIDSKVCPYEDSVRAPIMILNPRLGDGRLKGPNAATVSAIDLPPTILGMAGAKAPAAWPGRDLMPMLRGEGDAGVREAECEWVDDSSPNWGKWAYRSVFDGRWKLIVWAAAGKKAELYDVDSDPHEERDLAGAEPERVKELKARLRAWLEKTGDVAAGWGAVK